MHFSDCHALSRAPLRVRQFLGFSIDDPTNPSFGGLLGNVSSSVLSFVECQLTVILDQANDLAPSRSRSGACRVPYSLGGQ